MGIRERIGNVGRNLAGAAGETLIGFAEDNRWFKAGNLDPESDERAPGGSSEDNPENAPPPQEAATDDPKTLFWDPFSIIEQLGYKDRPSNVTYGTLKAIVWKIPIVQTIIKTRLNQMAAFCRPSRDRFDMGFKFIRRGQPKEDLTPAERKWADQMETIILRTGVTDNPRGRDSFEIFTRKFMRDSLTYDQGTFEVVPNRQGQPAEWYATDGASHRLADSASTYLDEDATEATRYVQIYDGMVITEYKQDELCFGIRNPTTDMRLFGYGTSELEMLLNVMTSLLWAWEYNQKAFSQGSSAKGILNFKGAVSDKQLKAFRRHWYQMLSGVENCVSGNTVIWTGDGAFPIQGIVADGNDKTVMLWTGDSWKESVVYKTREKKRLVKTTLGNGLVLGTSPDHRFRVLGDAGEPTWKSQEDLNLGDFVLVNKEPMVGTIDLPEYRGHQITPELMEVLGWMVGDGYLISQGRGHQKANYVRWFYHPEKERDICAQHRDVLRGYDSAATLKEKFLSEETREGIRERYGFKNVAKSRLSVDLFGVDFVEWLMSLGFTTSANGKVIPPFVHTLPLEYKTSFLRGLFSADGHCAKNRSPEVTITNDSLREQVKLLLLSVGIRTNLSEGRTKMVIQGRARGIEEAPSLLRVRDKDVFFERVGFLQAHKQPKPLKQRNEAGKRSLIAQTAVLRFLRLVRHANDASGKMLLTKRQRMDLNSILSGQDKCSLPRLLRFMRMAGVEAPSWLTGYYFEPVVDVEVTNEFVPMYDVEVHDDRHQFVASGVVTHNSWRTPITNAEDLQWIALQNTNQEMEYSAWFDFLIKVACGMFDMDPLEINFKYGNTGQKSAMQGDQSNKDKINESRERGLRPLLNYYAACLNRHIIWPVNESMELIFTGLDAMTREDVAKNNQIRVRTTATIDQLRAEDGDPPLADGEGDIILDPTFLAARTAKQQQAQQEAQGGEFGDEEDDDDDDDEDEPDFEALLNEGSDDEGNGKKGAPGGAAKPGEAAKSMRPVLASRRFQKSKRGARRRPRAVVDVEL